MTYPPQSGQVPVPQYPAAPAYRNQPEYFQPRGPMLPQRTWQRRTRTPVIVATVIGVILLCSIGVVAFLTGVVSASSFTAKGYVVTPCDAGRTGAQPSEPVSIFGETGDGLGRGALGSIERNDSACFMRFTISGVRAGESGYLVQVGDVISQTVSESALRDGVVLRPLS